MDGYLSKPIDVNHLLVTVEQFGIAGGEGTDAAPTAGETAADFDEIAALSHTGGDRALLKELVALFRADYPASLRRIEKAIRGNDGEALRAAAHAVKGAIATVGGSAGRQAAADLERLGESGSFGNVEVAFATLRDRIGKLEAAFTAAGLIGRSGRKRAAPGGSAARTKRSRR